VKSAHDALRAHGACTGADRSGSRPSHAPPRIIRHNSRVSRARPIMDGKADIVSLAAFALPERWIAGSLPEGTDLAALERWGSTLRTLIADVRRDRPDEGTAAETSALMRAAEAALDGLRLLGPDWVAAFREGVNATLQALVRKELSAAETKRKFALRQIEQAAHTFGVLIESVGAVVAELPAADVRAWLGDVASRVRIAHLSLTPADRLVLRFELDLCVALATIDAPVDELTFWAFRVATGARRVEALPSPTVVGLRGEFGRLRSQRSWLSWDAADIQQELAPWPPTAPSR
jgi:hypothetical protein